MRLNFYFSFVEESQVLMAQRNEGLLSSANQNQNRVLTLEQDKVGLFICEKLIVD